jgi:DNA-binding HxlR family transcriptional regulator
MSEQLPGSKLLRMVSTKRSHVVAQRLLENDTFPDNCPTRAVLDRITTRWSTLIVAALVLEPHRFAELRRRIEGISEKMLSQNLKTLVTYGLVHREVEPTVPPKVTYSLTPLGEELAVPLCALIGWVGDHANDLLGDRRDLAAA